MKPTLITELRGNFVAVLQAVYEADTAVAEANVRDAMIALAKADASLQDVRKKLPAQIPPK